MQDLTVTRLDEIQPYDGPHAIPGIRFRPAAATLGVSSWGMNVLELDAGCEGHPEHDHTQDGQEEVYFVVEGSATLRAGEHEFELPARSFVRVPPALTRKIIPGPQGVVILAMGAVPGEPYKSMF